MTDVADLLARQAEEQKKLRELSWPEKIRLAERIRDDAARLRKSDAAGRGGPNPRPSPNDPPPKG